MNERIIELRKALHLTQSEFGKAIGLTASGVSDVESGRRAVQDRHIKLIMAAFPQVSEEWLRTGSGDMFNHDDSPVKQIMAKYGFRDIVEKLLVAYDKLDPDEQEAVLKYAAGFIAEISGGISEPASPPPFTEIDIDKEVEAYRRQIIAQKMAGSYHSSGTDAIGEI